MKMNIFKAIGFIIIFIMIMFLLELGGLKWTKFFAPKRENIRREVFINTRSYVEGKIQALTKYRLEYMRADSEGDKQAITSAIRIGFAEVDRNKLPYELKRFLDSIM